MPTGVSRRKGFVAFAKQTAFGTPVADGATKYAVPQRSGGMHPMRDRGDIGVTSSSQARRGMFIQRARGEGTVAMLAHPDPLGLLLLAAMGTDTPSGTTHVFTMNDVLSTVLTVWSLVGDEWWKFPDTFIQSLTIRGTSGENYEIEVGFLSFDAQLLSSAPSYTVEDEDPRFKYIDSLVKMEANSATPTQMDNVENVELVINRNLELRYGSSLTPTTYIPGRDVDFSCGIVYDSGGNQGWDFLHGAQLGVVAASGSVGQDLIKGSFEVTGGKHPSSYVGSMVIASNGADWEYGVERPDPDPGGGPIEMTIAGPVIPPPDDTEITITLINEKSGAY